VSTGKSFPEKRARGTLCSAENSIANAMMPDPNVNAGRGSSILRDEKGKGRLALGTLLFLSIADITSSPRTETKG
jgi:hypothetical protein